jgi:hypothetical protein
MARIHDAETEPLGGEPPQPIRLTLGALSIDTGLVIDTAAKVALVGQLILFLVREYREVPPR